MRKKSSIKFLAVSAFLLVTACSNAPAVIPQTATPRADSTPPAQVTQTRLPNAAPSTAAEPSGLKVAYNLNDNLWFWSETTPARQLTDNNDVGPVKLSDDSKVIVFQRAQTLWAINTDGASLRQLVDVPAFTGNPVLGQFDFQPSTHIVYFTSRASAQAAASDLRRVDADAPAPQTVLAQGGGQFTFSPNGRLAALAGPTRINIANTNGAGLVSALDFHAVKTGSDQPFLPQIVWLSNSSGFYTVIPASDAAANPSQKSRFLYVAADGSFAAQLAEFAAAPVNVAAPLIAPNGSKVAYVTQKDQTLDIHVIDASTADLLVASHPDTSQIGLWAWSPDSARFVYWAGDSSRPLLAGIQLPSVPLADAFAPASLTWIDADRFLYFAHGELRLGKVGDPLLSVIASGFPDTGENTSFYDFAP